MAKTQFAFGLVNSASGATPAPAIIAATCTVETVAPTGSTAATTAAAPAGFGSKSPICRVATDTQVYVSFGSAPNAGTDTIRFLMPANCVEYFYVDAAQKAAVITA